MMFRIELSLNNYSTVEFLILVAPCCFTYIGVARGNILKLTVDDQKVDGVEEIITPVLSLSAFLLSLSIQSCPEFESTILAMTYGVRLVKAIVVPLARRHDETLELLNLDGWREVADASLMAIADNFPLSNDLDVFECAITDYKPLSCEVQVNLHVFFLSYCFMVSSKSIVSSAFILVAVRELCQQTYLSKEVEAKVVQDSLPVLILDETDLPLLYVCKMTWKLLHLISSAFGCLQLQHLMLKS
ncbi:hypothetical protein K7X08_031948 [Anisodus acutangulus]|uniref:Uncharacterized protein n=1 Tax=Anisodus acutangulus TaxID=402998 RepID=A0A9Q1RN76_9SOLA|nr:hypothetical protein K7X08_031948 [Anisodus acutangulus]